MKKLGIIIASIILISSCTGYYHVTSVSKGETAQLKKNGFFYALPETHIKVEVSIIKKEHIKGPYAEYADKLLGIQNVITENNSTYEIGNIRISSYAEPNPEQFYFVEANKIDIATSFNKLGLLEMVSTQNSKTINQKRTESKTVTIKEDNDDEDIMSLFRVHAELNTYEKIDTIIKKVVKDTVTTDEMILQKTTVEKSQREKAEEIAKHITKIKNKRFDLISGGTEVNYDAKAFSYMYMQLEALENKYLKLFTGITNSSEETFTFIIKPEQVESDIKEYVICNFSPTEGITTSSNDQNKALTLLVENTGKTHAIKEILNKPATKKNDKKGFYYCIPETAKVYVMLNDKVKADGIFQISQLGVVTNLAPNKITLKLNSETGNIENFKIK